MRFKNATQPDLQSQLESLLDQVWRSESDWRLWDRVDQAVMLEAIRAKRAQGTNKRTTGRAGMSTCRGARVLVMRRLGREVRALQTSARRKRGEVRFMRPGVREL